MRNLKLIVVLAALLGTFFPPMFINAASPCADNQYSTDPAICSPRFQQGEIVKVKPIVRFVWLRNGPNSGAAAIATVYSGALLEVERFAEYVFWDGYQWWWRLHLNTLRGDVSGWVEQASLETSGLPSGNQSPATWRTPFPARAKAGLPFLWLRATPASNAPITLTILPWQRCTVLGSPMPVFDGRQWWWAVQISTIYGPRTGWIEQASIQALPR